jgi:hypothetical protein
LSTTSADAAMLIKLTNWRPDWFFFPVEKTMKLIGYGSHSLLPKTRESAIVKTHWTLPSVTIIPGTRTHLRFSQGDLKILTCIDHIGKCH